jgi:hypothetical protein
MWRTVKKNDIAGGSDLDFSAIPVKKEERELEIFCAMVFHKFSRIFTGWQVKR